MPGIIKIGFTNKTIEERLKTLDNTSVVEPFQLYYAGKVKNPKRVEGVIHDLYKPYRIRSNREFFEVDPEEAKKVIQVAEASSDLYIESDADTPEIEYTLSEVIDPEEAPSDTESKSPKRSRKDKKEEKEEKEVDKLEKFKYKRKDSSKAL